MVFDFNAWNLKWRDSDNPEEREFYWNKLQKVKKDFSDDWRMFLECYNDPTHIMRINDEFLDEKIEEILAKDLYLPSDFRCYLYDRYPQLEKKLRENGANQIGSERNSSVLASGLKPLIASTYYDEDKTQLLLFEVAEFALTYPEYEDVFIEEIVE